MSDSRPRPTIYLANTDRDRWTEKLSCLCCGTTGITHLSTADKFSWDIQVDSVSEGFKAIVLAFGSKFVCSLCDDQAHP
jgi:hypothetical protein